MQKIIIQGQNNRGNSTRISTKEDFQILEIYFQGPQGEIRKADVILSVDCGELTIGTVGDTVHARKIGDCASLSILGEKAEKLAVNR